MRCARSGSSRVGSSGSATYRANDFGSGARRWLPAAPHRSAANARARVLAAVLPDALSPQGRSPYRRRQQQQPAPVPQSTLRVFLDSADMKQWSKWHNMGLFHGVTTNPAILERDGVRCTMDSLTALTRTAFEMGAREVQLQTWGSTVQAMSSNALNLAGIDPRRVVVKLPCTPEGIQAASLLSESDIRVTITGIYASHQVLLAEAVGAEYAAPYLGRMNDLAAGQGTVAVREMQDTLTAHHSTCRLLVASIRDVAELSQLSAMGCDTFTISPSVAEQWFKVEGTINAARDFESAAERMGAPQENTIY